MNDRLVQMNGGPGNKLRVLMVQPQLRWQKPAENLEQLGQLIKGSLSHDKADLILLPETFTTGFLGDLDREPESMEGEAAKWMRRLARKFDAAVGGSVVIGEDGKRLNRFLFVTPDGAISHYDKRHLFAHGGEHKLYSAGKERVIVSFRGWRIALNICYDLRFPVWCRNRDDYDLSVFVANWPATRATAWGALLKARALENQAYAIGINRVGRDGNGLEYLGLSAAYDGLGEELLNLGGEVAARIVTLDLDGLRTLRRDLPFLADADTFTLNI